MIGRICAVVMVFGSTCRFFGSAGGAGGPPLSWARATVKEPARATMAKAPTTCLKRIMLTPLTLGDNIRSTCACTISSDPSLQPYRDTTVSELRRLVAGSQYGVLYSS